MKIRRPYIEYSVSDSCTLKCDNCTHFSPYFKTYFPTVESYEKDITALANVIRVRKLRLLGGEPFLNKNILDFIEIGKRSGISNQVGVCTNGTLYKKISDDIFKKLDYLDVDLYPNTGLDNFDAATLFTEKSKEFKFKLRLIHKDSFLKINIDKKLPDGKTQKIWDECNIAHTWQCIIFREGYVYRCAKPIHQNKYFDHIGVKTDIDYTKVDGCPIEQDNLRSRLEEYLTRKEPLESCKFCLGTSGPREPHRQLNRDEINAH
jgi:organic radical activating enzyme